MSEPARTPARQGGVISYEESKRLLRDPDPAVRAELAARPDVRPEILYYLADDESVDVRRQVAGNRRTPVEADLLLARDSDCEVRSGLAVKTARLLPELGDRPKQKAHRRVIETLEILARDQVTRVRVILSQTLKDMTAAPAAVIQRLARDGEVVVARPILEFSPLLSDQDLLEIIAEARVTGKLCAISRRRGLGSQVSDALAATEDATAIAALLCNHSAQIREETLDQLVERASGVKAWHGPLVGRPQMSGRATLKLATFVPHPLLERLQARDDLDEVTVRLVAEELHCRFDETDARHDDLFDAVAREISEMHAAGRLTEQAMSEALTTGDRGFVRQGLSLLADMPTKSVEKILTGGSPKGQTAMVWKAGLSMGFAAQLQLRMGGIPPQRALRPQENGDFPLTEQEMGWRLALFDSLSA